MIEPIRAAGVAVRATEAAGLADTLMTASRVGGTGVINTAALAEKVAAVGSGNPQQAMDLAREINGKLPFVDQQRFQSNLTTELAERNLPSPAAGATDAAAATARKELALDVTQMALDVAGLFDPTPASDGANAVISLFRGDFLGAGLSAVSIIPYIGDAAKLGKLGKWAQTVERAVDLAKTDSAFAKLAGPALEKLRDAIGGVPKAVLDALPQSARDTLVKMKSKLDDIGGAVAHTAPLPARMSREAFDALPPISGPGAHVKPVGENWRPTPNWDNWTAQGNKIVANNDGSYTFIRATDQAQVRYSAQGFPDFKPHLDHPSGVKEVPVAQTGNDSADFRAANRAAGHPEWGSRPPAGYTWHHNENGTVMQLVPRNVHAVGEGGFGHRGGASIVTGGR